MSENIQRRFVNACDECRRRKVRCDSECMPNKVCSSCLSKGVSCRHSRIQQKRGPKRSGTTRIDASQPLDILVTKILQSTETNPFHVPDDKNAVRGILFNLALRLKTLEKELDYCRKNHVGSNGLEDSLATSLTAPDSSPSSGSPDSEPDKSVKTSTLDEKDSITDLSDALAQFTIGFPTRKIHFGESSNIMLVVSALNHRKELSLPEWKSVFARIRRPKFWEVPSSPLQPQHPNFTFPESSLMQKLIHYYFIELNVYCPLLHRPTFEKSIADELHLHDPGFGSLVLVVCAIGARAFDFYSGRKIFASDVGWEWFNQVSLEKIVFEQNLSLYHLQMLILSIWYLKHDRNRPNAGWMLTGIAMRVAQERGVHRRSVDDSKPTVEGELWKRAFWMLTVIDTRMSWVFGRPKATSTQDFDLSPLVECDDEYWETEDPEQNFQQPVGKPSLLSFWNCYTRLFEIVGFSQRTIYSVRKSELQKMDINNSEWQEKTVIELDSALNKWADSVPTHLRWDTPHINEFLFSQSAILYTMYYWVQIQIHRRFIPRPGQKSEVSLPSLTICTNAARSCVKVCDAHCQRRVFPYGEFIIIPLFNSAMILTVNLWKSTQTSATRNATFNRELADIYKCVELIRIYESKSADAGRLIDIINTVISASHYPSMTSSSVPSGSSQSVDTSNTGIPPSDTRPSQNFVEINGIQPQEPSSFHLPLYTDELGSFSSFPDSTTTSYYGFTPAEGQIGQVQYDKLFDPSVPVPQSQTTSTPNVVGIEGDFHFENEQTLYQDTGNNSSHFCLNDPTSFSGSSGADIDMWPGDPSYAQDWDSFMASVEAMIQSQD